MSSPDKSKTKSAIFAAAIALLVVLGIAYQQYQKNTSSAQPESSSQLNSSTQAGGTNTIFSPGPSNLPSPDVSPVAMNTTTSTNSQPDLTVDANGLSKATVIMTTNQGVIKLKFYPKDAPTTVNRIIELINKGFYNGLAFHRVVPGFVIQGGDPVGNGSGGSGQKLKAEFNERRHIEGTVAMARTSDPNSADSQFYISLGTHPHLDRNYTVFGQVTEGMDVARKIKVGDKMTSVTVE
jgi:cyclophilin family peptidyl-prolyl cis-trans isomerase